MSLVLASKSNGKWFKNSKNHIRFLKEQGTRNKEIKLGGQEWLWFHVWFITILYYKTQQPFSQNATTNFITKCDKCLLQNASAFLVQNATVLLQNATFITKCVSTSCNIN